MLTTPSNLPVIIRLGNGFQSYLFHHVPRDQGEANWPMVSQILPLALFEDKE